jgi:quercetin dioxygenase-like cupin family protein
MPYDPPGTGLDRPAVDLGALVAERGDPPWRAAVVASPHVRVVLLAMTPGTITVPHYHPRAEEMFQVIVGRVGLTIGEVEHIVEAGSFLLAPHGTRHRIRIPGPDPAVLMCIVTPNEDAHDEQVEVA